MTETFIRKVCCKLVKAIMSMYTAVTFCFEFKSSFFPHLFGLHIGLKQGDPRSPLLFMLNVNDSLDYLNADPDIFLQSII